VLSAYAPDLRSGNDGRAHALSHSAIGFAGVPVLMKGLGQSVVINRTRVHDLANAAVILTPDAGDQPTSLKPFADASHVLIILPKWSAFPDPLRRGYVRKAGIARLDGREYTTLLSDYSKASLTAVRKAVGKPVLHGAGGPFAEGTTLPLGRIDRLQTVRGEGWAPALVDETGATVLAYSKKDPKVWLLADPDLLNNQGLASLDTARAGVAVLRRGQRRRRAADPLRRDPERLRARPRLWPLMLEPPWLAATLIAVAAARPDGLPRPGPLRPAARARPRLRAGRARAGGQLRRPGAHGAQGARAGAGLCGPAARRWWRAAGGGHAAGHWLDDLAARRGAASPARWRPKPRPAKTRDDLLAVAKKLYDWRGEMTRERR
jgi:hypothetical protein